MFAQFTDSLQSVTLKALSGRPGRDDMLNKRTDRNIQMRRTRPLPLFSLLIVALIMLAGCGNSTDPFFYEPDFTDVPDLPDISEYEPVEYNGITYYIIEEGEGDFKLQERNDELLSIFLTFRIQEGMEILQSTYADFNTQPENVTVEDLSDPAGLLDGVLGMKEGERRVIVVPPDRGFANVSQNSQFYPFRDDTLIYDIEIVRFR
jgi:hypothetical protein